MNTIQLRFRPGHAPDDGAYTASLWAQMQEGKNCALLYRRMPKDGEEIGELYLSQDTAPVFTSPSAKTWITVYGRMDEASAVFHLYSIHLDAEDSKEAFYHPDLKAAAGQLGVRLSDLHCDRDEVLVHTYNILLFLAGYETCRLWIHTPHPAYCRLLKHLMLPEARNALLHADFSSTDQKELRRMGFLLNLGFSPRQLRWIDTDLLARRLEENVVGCAELKRELVTYISKSRQKNQPANIFLAGPPGTAKTVILNTIAGCAAHASIIDCGGVSSSMMICGCEFSFSGSREGSILEGAAGGAEVFGLDELDGMTQSYHNGNPYEPLKPLLESRTFSDLFAGCKLGIPAGVITATGNSFERLPPSLQSRFQVFYVSRCSVEEKMAIARKRLFPSLDGPIPQLSDRTLRRLIIEYAPEAGCRSLRTVCTKLVSELENHPEMTGFTLSQARKALGRPHLSPVQKLWSTYYQYEQAFPFSPEEREEILSGLERLEDVKLDSFKRDELEERLTLRLSMLPHRLAPICPERFFQDLNETHLGMERLKKLLFSAFFSAASTGTAPRPFLLIGPPGVGKSTLCRAAAKSFGLPAVIINCDTVTTPNDLLGCRLPHMTQAGMIVRALAQKKTDTALIIFDELDHMTPSAQYTLMELMDTRVFEDKLVGKVDLRHSLIAATCNQIDNLVPALYNRLRPVCLDDYSAAEKKEILRKKIIPAALAATGSRLSFSEAATARMVDEYCVTTGVRELQSFTETIRDELLPTNAHTVTAQTVRRILGVPPHTLSNPFSRFPRPGMVHSLSVAGQRGCLSAIEVTENTLSPGVQILGMVQQSAEESVLMAANLAMLDCGVSRKDLLVSFGAGAASVKKDGSSAGIMLYLAFRSYLNGTVLPADFSGSGEIDAQGNVFAIGGVAEKLRCAKETGLRLVFLPRKNERDVTDELRKELDGLEIVLVEHVSEIVQRLELSSGLSCGQAC